MGHATSVDTGCTSCRRASTASPAASSSIRLPRGGPGGDHARAFRPRAPRPSGGARQRRHAGADARPHGRRTGPARRSRRWAGARALRVGDVTPVAAARPGHVLGSAQVAMEYRGTRAVVSGDYKRTADPTCAGLRAGAVRRVRHRGDLRAAGVPPSAARAGDRQAAGQCGAVSGSHPRRRLLRSGQMPAR